MSGLNDLTHTIPHKNLMNKKWKRSQSTLTTQHGHFPKYWNIVMGSLAVCKKSRKPLGQFQWQRHGFECNSSCWRSYRARRVWLDNGAGMRDLIGHAVAHVRVTCKAEILEKHSPGSIGEAANGFRWSKFKVTLFWVPSHIIFQHHLLLLFAHHLRLFSFRSTPPPGQPTSQDLKPIEQNNQPSLIYPFLFIVYQECLIYLFESIKYI